MQKANEEQQPPLRFLNKMLNKQVVVKLKTGKMLRGSLNSFDYCMNIVVNDAEELDYHNDQVMVKYGKVLIRGGKSSAIYSGEGSIGGGVK